MGVAHRLARLGLGKTAPNPAVGAVVAHRGNIIATGFHQSAGGDHAEVAALRKLGFSAPGATLYTTLEPCHHQGRTGPCTVSIERAGIIRVVVGAADPNPLVRGRGVRQLRRWGIEVTQGVLRTPCRQLNEAYNYAILRRRAFVVLKSAASLDGRTATRAKESQWITSTPARREGHHLRSASDGILVGLGTVVADDPRLTARVPRAAHPARIVVDSRLRVPLEARIVRTANDVRTLVATTQRAPPQKKSQLARLGVEVLTLPSDPHGRVELDALLGALFTAGLNQVLVEGGPTLQGALMDLGLVNKVVFFVAPKLIGGRDAPGILDGQGVAHISDAIDLARMDAKMVGPDLMITASVKARKSPTRGPFR